jgi:hypothetical protein
VFPEDVRQTPVATPEFDGVTTVANDLSQEISDASW